MRLASLPVGLREGLRSACSARSTIVNGRHRLQDNTARGFSTSSQFRESIAAPEINFSNFTTENGPVRKDLNNLEAEEDDTPVKPPTSIARLAPASPSYFTGMPNFTDDLLSLQKVLDRYISLPVVKPGEAPRVAWRQLREYRDTLGENIKQSKFGRLRDILQRLNQIHPSLMPPIVAETLEYYKRDIDPYRNKTKTPVVGPTGLSVAGGRRKTASATAHLVEGTGEVIVNGKSLTEAFGRIHDRESVIWALKATGRVDKYNLWARVSGGGTTGQAEALTLAVGKALIAQEPALKPALRRAGCVTRDPRRVERKKPGRVKARKKPAWVKR